MKFLVVLALAAVALAEPEADPAYVLANNQFVYKQHAILPTTYTYAANPAMYYSQYINPFVVAKTDDNVKEDNVEPDTTKPAENTDVPAGAVTLPEVIKPADAKIVLPYAYTPYNVAQTYHYAAPAVIPQVTYQVPKYYAQSAPGVAHTVYKREAEAEADALYYANALPYSYNYGYAAPVAALNYGYRAPVAAYNYGYRAPVALNYGYNRFF